MNALLHDAPERKLLLPANTAFKVVFAYDDTNAKAQAEQVFATIMRAFTDDLEFQTTWLRFEQLNDPLFAHEAAEVAFDSDLIVIAASGNDSLPASIESWSAQWPVRNGERALALVVGVQPGQDFRETAVWSHFAERARNNNLTLFEKVFVVPAQRSPDNCRCTTKHSLPDTYKNHRCCCWQHGGINE